MAKPKSETFYIILQYLHIFSKTVVVPTLVSKPAFISRAPACYICSHSEGVLLCACLHWTLAKAPFTFCSCRTWISLWLVATNESPVKIQRRRLFQWKNSQLNWNSWKTTTLYDTTTPNQRQNSQPLPNLQDPRQVGSSWQCFRPFLLPRQHNPFALWFTIEFLRGLLYHVWTI